MSSSKPKKSIFITIFYYNISVSKFLLFFHQNNQLNPDREKDDLELPSFHPYPFCLFIKFAIILAVSSTALSDTSTT